MLHLRLAVQQTVGGYDVTLDIDELREAENSKITVTLDLDASAIDEAQQKADKLKATLLEVQELIRQTNSISAT